MAEDAARQKADGERQRQELQAQGQSNWSIIDELVREFLVAAREQEVPMNRFKVGLFRDKPLGWTIPYNTYPSRWGSAHMSQVVVLPDGSWSFVDTYIDPDIKVDTYAVSSKPGVCSFRWAIDRAVMRETS